MKIARFRSLGSPGSLRSASATFWSGPTAMRVTSPGWALAVSDQELGRRLGDGALGGEVLGPFELVVDPVGRYRGRTAHGDRHVVAAR